MSNFNKNNFQPKYTPRLATAEELIQLTSFLLQKFHRFYYGEEEYKKMEAEVQNSFIAVCDDFQGKKTLMVIWDAGIDCYEVFEWNTLGELVEIDQNPAVTDPYSVP
jgi:hypothetical protein